MIILANSREGSRAAIYDRGTKKYIGDVHQFDPETDEAWVYKRENGIYALEQDGQTRIIVKYPGAVFIHMVAAPPEEVLAPPIPQTKKAKKAK